MRRFDDLKATVYRMEQKSGTIPSNPRIFQLSTNYRSHQGITACAHRLVTALLTLFPDTIDRLAEERGIVDGPKPLWLNGGDEDNVESQLIGFMGKGGGEIDFGAKHAIIVRDDAARVRLRERIGDQNGLVLTIFEVRCY